MCLTNVYRLNEVDLNELLECIEIPSYVMSPTDYATRHGTAVVATVLIYVIM